MRSLRHLFCKGVKPTNIIRSSSMGNISHRNWYSHWDWFTGWDRLSDRNLPTLTTGRSEFVRPSILSGFCSPQTRVGPRG
ncbi:hypothetical protein FKM82_024506 [Ascaphus truei]